jgi:hypothetical protein
MVKLKQSIGKHMLENLKEKLKHLMLDVIHNERGNPGLVFEAVELGFQKFADQGYYIVYMNVSFLSELHLEIEVVTVPPDDYEYKEIRQALLDIQACLNIAKKMMIGFVIQYGQPILAQIAELPEQRELPYDLRKVPINAEAPKS